MRIGFFTDSYYPSRDGIAVSVETFRSKLEELGHEVYIFCPKAAEEVKERSSRITRVTASPSIWFDEYRDSWPINPRLIRDINKLNLDIIHIHTQFQLGLVGTYIAKANHIPLITTYHANFEAYVELYRRFLPALFFMNLMVPIVAKDAQSWREGMSLMQPEWPISQWNRKLVRHIIKYYASQCAQVIAPSKKIKNMLLELGVSSPIEIIQTGVDDSLFEPTPPFVRTRYNLDSKTILMFVGRVRPEKNIELLIEAFNILYSKYPDLVLVIAGSGKHTDNLKEQAQKLGVQDRVIFTGGLTRNEVYTALKEADIFAFPSITETQGLVVDEAVLAGLPVVMVDHEVSEVAKRNRNAIFSDNASQPYAEAIERLVKDKELRRQYSQQSKQISAEFSATKQAEKLAQCYHQLIGQKESKTIV